MAEGPLDPLWGCAHNEERSPYSTGRQTCAGEVRYRRAQFGPRWICDKHEAKAQRAAAEDAFWEAHYRQVDAEREERNDG